MTDLATPFRALCDEYGIDPDDLSNSANEDAGCYLTDDPDYVLAPFVLVTHAGEFTYLKCHASRGEAIRWAFENAGDDIYAEFPSLIVNLETGARIAPDFDQCPWKPVKS